MKLTVRKPHIRLYAKRPNGGAWFAVVRFPGWSSVTHSAGCYPTLPQLFEYIRKMP